MTAPATLYAWGLTAPGLIPRAVDADSRAVPLTRDIGFDHKTGRFTRSGGRLQLTTGQESIRQAVMIKLRFFLGEWWLDATKGVPYFQSILIKTPNIPAIKAEIANQIRTVRGVRSVTSLNANFNKQTRELAIDFSADTDFGTIDGAVPFTL